MKKILFLLLVLMIPTSVVFAKGNFDYIIIKGLGITGDMTVTDPVFTGDFFAFADFSKGAVPPPANPGEGYQILRIYVVDMKDRPFDLFHYYPDSGYVYYDGVADGSSEYDKQWFVANPMIDKPFRALLSQNDRLTWYPFIALVLILAGIYLVYSRKQKEA